MNPATPRRAALIIGAVIALVVIFAACHHFFYDHPEAPAPVLTSQNDSL